jgi:ribosomal-protein-alanine N-acetyltransferase
MTTGFPVLKTERLLLREILPADIQYIFRGLSDTKVIQHFEVSFHSLEATADQMKWYADMILNDTGRCWAICNTDNSIFYGVATLNFWKKKHRTAETGYWILPEYWGKGIVTEAMRAILDHGFTSMNLHRISAEVEDDNRASIAVIQKLGFAYEGTRKECEIKEGRFINLQMFALIKSES